jgi:chemotaxis response regulator CheB
LKPSRIYIAPPANHPLIKARKILVTKGATENRYRPGIDPLFRSAAVSHGSCVIGVVLTGMMDDGTAGLLAVKRCGVTVVQDPRDAAYSGQGKENQSYIERIRAMLLDPRSDSPADTLTRVQALMAEPRQAKSTR